MPRTRQLLLTTAIALLAGAALCGSAWGATVQVIEVQVPVEDDVETVSVAALNAAPGEANRVRVSPGPTAGTVLFEDLGAVLAVGTGCISIDTNHASCTSQVGERVVVNTGDMTDIVDASPGVAIDVNGGPGTDLLTGADESDKFDGGGGAVDGMRGGGGDDFFTDGDGIDGAPIDHDVYHGGAGHDTISYATRKKGVSVILTKVHQTEDVVAFIENLDGGKGNDEFNGTKGRNTINGGPGKDVIKGGKGADVVDGGTGADNIDAGDGSDVVTGGPGKDLIVLGSGNDRVNDSDQKVPTGNDEVKCGSGNDRVIATQDTSVDKVSNTCERFTVAESVADGNHIQDVDAITVRLQKVRRSGMDVLVPVRCERSSSAPACVITGRLRGPNGGATLASTLAHKTLKGGKSATLRLHLTAAGLDRVRRGKQFRLQVADRTAKNKIEFDKRASAQVRTLLH